MVINHAARIRALLRQCPLFPGRDKALPFRRCAAWRQSRASRPGHAFKRQSRQRGFLAVELVAAMALVLVAVIPLGFSFHHERQLCRIYYLRAIAGQMVDGEMEVLAAGAWRAVPLGSQEHQVKARAAANLPPGHFQLTRETRLLRLEWIPARKGWGGVIRREIVLP